MERIKILHIIDSLGRRGGAEKQLALELESVDPQRFDNSVCYLHEPDYLVPTIESMGVPVYRLNVKGKKQWIPGVRRLRRLVKSLDVDLIHTCLYEADIIGGLVGRVTGVPVVSTLTNTCYEPEWLVDNAHLNHIKLEFARLSRVLVAKYCDKHLVAISGAVKGSAVRQLGLAEDKVSVIYRALPPQWLENGSRPGTRTVEQEGVLPRGYPVLINTGRLEPQKGQRYIIEAMPRVLEHFPEAVLLIVGEGTLKSQLANLAQDIGVAERVFLLGQRNNVRQLLTSSDIFVFPSLYEGLGNALMEAMITGIPSVVSSIETFVEVTHEGKYGVLVPPQDSTALAEAVIDLAAQPKKALNMGRRAREMAKREFSLETVVNQRSAAYENCVGPIRK